jgi:uncharacterized damage-inducible protein DinB
LCRWNVINQSTSDAGSIDGSATEEIVPERESFDSPEDFVSQDHSTLIEEYLAGPDLLRQVVAGMEQEQFDARPVPGKWSTREVVAHIADFEVVYADRMKRVIAEEQPTFFGGDPDRFANRLDYAGRNIAEELELIAAVRRQVAGILRSLPADGFQRTGNHSEDGPMSLEQLLRNITNHIPHHVRFIEEKRQALRQ